jgi:enoyl-CoA hydratase
MQLATRIAEQSLFTLKLVKEAVNAAQDAQGRVNAMQTSFALHQLSHAHNQVVHGALADPAFTWGKSAATPSASITPNGEKA